MLSSTEKIVDSGLGRHVLTEVDLEWLLGGTPASRYGLVNKALKKGELIRLRRGFYTLAKKYLPVKLSKFSLANRIRPHSYVSFESALSYHQWIPERVVVTTSVVTDNRNDDFQTPLGEFSYKNIPINEYEFLTGVDRVVLEGQPFLLASPLRALADLVYSRKLDWQGIAFLTESLRIEREDLNQLDKEAFEQLKKVYRSKRVLKFIRKLQKEINKNEK